MKAYIQRIEAQHELCFNINVVAPAREPHILRVQQLTAALESGKHWSRPMAPARRFWTQIDMQMQRPVLQTCAGHTAALVLGVHRLPVWPLSVFPTPEKPHRSGESPPSQRSGRPGSGHEQLAGVAAVSIPCQRATVGIQFGSRRM